MNHDWVFHDVRNNRQIVRCRRCKKWDSYFISGYKPEPPVSECTPPEPQFMLVDVSTGRVTAI